MERRRIDHAIIPEKELAEVHRTPREPGDIN
jgi:hypothetical protein